jgi:hypothetical protein
MNTATRTAFSKVLCSMAVLALFIGCTAPAQASFILVSKGAIGTGTDASGLFVGAGSDLAGKTYKMTIAYDDLSTAFHTSSQTFDKESGRMTGVVGVTVDGRAFSANVVQSFGAMLYVDNNGAFSELTGFQSGNDAQSQNVYASHDLSSTQGTVAAPVIGMVSYTAVAGDIGRVAFTTNGPAGAASFTATPSVSWLVRPPAELISALVTYIDGAGLPKGIATSLLAKLASAQAPLSAGDVTGALQSITDLVNEARAQAGKQIPSAQAAEIIRQAQTTNDVIGVLYD